MTKQVGNTWDGHIEMVPVPMPMEEPHGWNARIGLLALSTDIAIERDFARMVPDDSVAIVTTRIHLETPNSDRTFRDLEGRIADAVRLLAPDSRLDSAVFGCTTASTIIGPENVAARVSEGRAGLKVTNPASGAAAAFRYFGARRVALVTPYTEQMTGNVIRFVEAEGVEPTSVRSFGFDTDVGIGSVPAEAFFEAAMTSKLSNADAIFLSCTATKALDIIEKLELASGLPVITSNQAAFWHALAISGRKVKVPGYGRLLRGE